MYIYYIHTKMDWEVSNRQSIHIRFCSFFFLGNCFLWESFKKDAYTKLIICPCAFLKCQYHLRYSLYNSTCVYRLLYILVSIWKSYYYFIYTYLGQQVYNSGSFHCLEPNWIRKLIFITYLICNLSQTKKNVALINFWPA